MSEAGTSETAPIPPIVRRKRRITLRRLGVALGLVVLAVASVYGLALYRQARSRSLLLGFARWVKAEVLEKNPVRYQYTSGFPPDWFGDADASVMTVTPTGQPIAIQIYVKSTPVQ